MIYCAVLMQLQAQLSRNTISHQSRLCGKQCQIPPYLSRGFAHEAENIIRGHFVFALVGFRDRGRGGDEFVAC